MPVKRKRKGRFLRYLTALPQDSWPKLADHPRNFRWFLHAKKWIFSFYINYLAKYADGMAAQRSC